MVKLKKAKYQKLSLKRLGFCFFEMMKRKYKLFIIFKENLESENAFKLIGIMLVNYNNNIDNQGVRTYNSVKLY